MYARSWSTGRATSPAHTRLFGPTAFDITMFALVDENEAPILTKALNCPETDLNQHGVLICKTDLEDEYVRGLGVARLIEALTGSGMYDVRQILAGCHASTVESIDPHALAEWCRGDKVKVAASLATRITAADAASVTVLADLVNRLVAS